MQEESTFPRIQVLFSNQIGLLVHELQGDLNFFGLEGHFTFLKYLSHNDIVGRLPIQKTTVLKGIASHKTLIY